MKNQDHVFSLGIWYSITGNSYLCLDPITRRIFNSRDVVFAKMDFSLNDSLHNHSSPKVSLKVSNYLPFGCISGTRNERTSPINNDSSINSDGINPLVDTNSGLIQQPTNTIGELHETDESDVLISDLNQQTNNDSDPTPNIMREPECTSDSMLPNGRGTDLEPINDGTSEFGNESEHVFGSTSTDSRDSDSDDDIEAAPRMRT